MAPEMLDDGGLLTEKVDIYSFGMVLYEISTGLIPFDKYYPIKMIHSILEGKRPILPSDCHIFFKPLIEECWDQDPNKRPTIINLCASLELEYLKLNTKTS